MDRTGQDHLTMSGTSAADSTLSEAQHRPRGTSSPTESAQLPLKEEDEGPPPDGVQAPSTDTGSQDPILTEINQKPTAQSPAEENDTCRICRQERSTEDPLFFPCKCSGSIKFVHQTCLVQWLSHAQKKHCELCKTTFRFTKLYSPNMPSGVPLLKFARQAVVHFYRTASTWLRIALVAIVWLGLFPWAMRCVWRGLFWLVEGGWVDWEDAERRTLNAEARSLQQSGFPKAIDLQQRAWSAESHVRNITANRVLLHVAKALPAMALKFFNLVFHFDQGGPILYKFIKATLLMFYTLIVGKDLIATETHSNKPETSQWRVRPSLLSEIRYLKALTPSPKINLIVVDILEGQLITLSLIVSFVLLFLIREWVLQQHPRNRPANNDQDAEATGSDQPNAGQSAAEQVDAAAPTGSLVVHSVPSQTEPGGSILEPSAPVIPSQTASDSSDPRHDGFRLEGSVEDRPSSEPRPKMPSREVRETYMKLVQQREGDRSKSEQQDDESVNRRTSALEASGDIKDRMTRVIEQGGPEYVSSHDTEPLRKQGTDSGSYARPKDLSQSRSSTDASLFKSQNTTDLDSDQITLEKEVDEPMVSAYEDVDMTNISVEVANTLQPEEVINSDAGNRQRSASQNLTAPRRPSSASNPEAQDAVAATEDGITLRTEENPPRTFVDEVLDWLWGGMVPSVDANAAAMRDEEHVVEDPQAEAPFVPAANNMLPPDQHEGDQQNQMVAADVEAAAREAGVNPAAEDDLVEFEDMDGIMELLGLQGPIEGLFQNAMFCALLVSVALIFGVWLPFVMGTSFVTTLSDPVLFLFKGPALLLSFIADTFVDCVIALFGCVFYWVDYSVRFVLRPVGLFSTLMGHISQDQVIARTARAQAQNAMGRLGSSFVRPSGEVKTIDLAVVSVIEHQALLNVEKSIRNVFTSMIKVFGLLLRKATTEDVSTLSLSIKTYLWEAGPIAFDLIYHVFGSWRPSLSSLSRSNFLNINIPSGRRSIPLDFSLIHWNARDRSIAIFFGYLSFTLTGAAYIHFRHWFEGKPKNEKVKGKIAEICYQMGGVLKVIVIIGIEMIVFPLYCGVLLDMALLPLVGDATISTRIAFSRTSPLTSLFVHWFAGTSYMFHFALFVATCRKLMRPGVLYFIKDPDDPDFHPVRDVLDRNLYTQLRKIASSAFIYGALIIIGLGGIIWGIDHISPGVFPVRWISSNLSSDLPVNLIFYNILVPIIVKSFKPTKAWNIIFGWWFRRCAACLRLSDFLFGTKALEERGRHVRRTWLDLFRREMGDVDSPMMAASLQVFEEQEDLRAYFLWNGSYARVPASDSVKPPRGHSAFLPVDQHNNRLDGQYDHGFGCHGYKDPQWTLVYIPPQFRLRIVTMMAAVWLFLAVAGCSATVLPLVMGRGIVGAVVNGVDRMCDIYAFSIGVAILPLPIYAYIYREMIKKQLDDALAALRRSLTARHLGCVSIRLASLIYFYGTLSVIFPLILSLILQTYLWIPLHTYFTSLAPTTASSSPSSPLPPHTIHLLQDWTLGLLYLRLIIKNTLAYPGSRFARAMLMVIPYQHQGWKAWLNPNIWAFTRLWVLPIGILAADILLTPIALGWMVLQTRIIIRWIFLMNNQNISARFGSPETANPSQEQLLSLIQALVYRYSYTAVTCFFIALVTGIQGLQWFRGWKRRIRDEVYLIGERLHNYTGNREDKKGRVSRRKDKGKGKEEVEPGTKVKTDHEKVEESSSSSRQPPTIAAAAASSSNSGKANA